MKKEFTNKLTKEQYKVLAEKGTEQPFTGKLLNNKDDGYYRCAACGNKLFSSKEKFDSGTGWPSFYDTVKDSVEFVEDNSHGMQRTEVICKKCGGHLGHVFDEMGHKRFCINSVCLEFEGSKKK